MLFLSLLALCFSCATARVVLELQGVNFELAITNSKYAAILFYDSSPAGQTFIEQWVKAAEGFNDSSDIHEDGEIAMVIQAAVIDAVYSSDYDPSPSSRIIEYR